MDAAEQAQAELLLEQIQEAETAAADLVGKLERLPRSRHLTIALAGVENAGFRIAAERRAIAGSVMKKNLPDPEDII